MALNAQRSLKIKCDPVATDERQPALRGFVATSGAVKMIHRSVEQLEK